MNKRQKVLFSQLQLAGLGVVLAVFGLIEDLLPITLCGAGVFVFGIARFFLFRSLTRPDEDDENLS